jgi:hypothetical protein
MALAGAIEAIDGPKRLKTTNAEASFLLMFPLSHPPLTNWGPVKSDLPHYPKTLTYH